MGDKITRPAQSADLVRAKLLKEALERGIPALSRAQEPDPEAILGPAKPAAHKAYL
jgi:hypothetical protein